MKTPNVIITGVTPNTAENIKPQSVPPKDSLLLLNVGRLPQRKYISAKNPPPTNDIGSMDSDVTAKLLNDTLPQQIMRSLLKSAIPRSNISP